MAEKRIPSKTYRVGGVEVAVWDNKPDQGKEYSTFTIRKQYKDKNTDDWKESKALFFDDLLRLNAIINAVSSSNISKAAVVPEQKSNDNQDGGL